MAFPEEFVWGAAAASYQIEGGAYEDGKGLSVWDMLCKRPGAIYNGHTGDVACDHYHRYQEDVALMKQIGLQAYRFSISWPRVIPGGTGGINEKGLGFYDKLVDQLVEAGIAPYVTLFHWDYPYDLYLKGGWLNPDSSDWFAEYTGVVIDRLSDRVSNWMTLNEPQCFILLGHQTGMHAPGLKLDTPDLLMAIHNTLLAHGKAVQVIRAKAKTSPSIGMATVAVIKSPVSDSPADIEAARKAMFKVNDINDLWANPWWLDPIYLGKYPEDGLKIVGDRMPQVTDTDLKTISQPLDYFALNAYNGIRIKADSNGDPIQVTPEAGEPLTAFYWPVTPECLYWGPRFYSERYGNLPVIVTENGLANQDWVHVDGKVHDPQRIDFLTRYLRQFERAGRDGVEIRGYFQWSIMDNFEWAEGYKQRFGLIFVDYQTGERTLKDSAYWYSSVISSNGDDLLG